MERPPCSLVAAIAGSCLLLLVTPLPAHSQSAATDGTATAGARRTIPINRDTATKRRENFESGWPRLQAALKTWSSLREAPRDFRGVAPAHDVTHYIFPAEQRRTIESRRKEAQEQFDGGDWPGAILLYGMLVAEANGVVDRLKEVGHYWVWYQAQDRRMERWRRTVRVNDLADPRGPEIAAVEKVIKEQVRQNQFGGATAEQMARSDALFRLALEEARAAAPGGVLRDDPMRRLPRKPCADGDSATPIAPAETGTIAPKLDIGRSGTPDSYYPLVARYNGTEGVVTLRVLTSPSGCVIHAEIAATSGNDLLDDAAMEWATDGAKFSPATTPDGRTVTASMQFNVRFKLH